MKEENTTNEELAKLINNLRSELKDIKDSGATRAMFYSRIESELSKLKETIGGLRVEISDLKK